MGLIAEGFEVERPAAAAQLGAQWGEASMIDALRPQDESVGALFKLKLVSGFDSQCLQDARRKRNLTLGGDLYQHDQSQNKR